MKKQNSYFWIPCQSSSNITDLLTQTLNPMFRKSFYKKYIQIFCLLIFKKFLFTNFRVLQKTCFRRAPIFSNEEQLLFR